MRVTRAALVGAGGPAAAAGDLTTAKPKAVTPVSVCGRAAGPYRMCRPPIVLRVSSRSPPSSVLRGPRLVDLHASPGSVRFGPVPRTESTPLPRTCPGPAGRGVRSAADRPSASVDRRYCLLPLSRQHEGTTAGENPAFSSLLTHDTPDNACSLFLTLPRSPRHTGHTCHNTVLQPRS